MRLSMLFLAVTMAVAMATASSGALAAGASPPAPNCDDAVNTLLPCFAFVTSSTDAPSPECCTAFTNVAKNSPTCLCSLASGDTAGINATRALELPSLCEVLNGVRVDPSCPAASSPTLPPAEPAPVPPFPSPKTPGGGLGAGQPSPSPSSPSAGTPGSPILVGAPESAAQSSIFVSRWYAVWGLATLAATAILGA